MDIFPSDILRKILKIVPHKQRLVLSGVNKQWKMAIHAIQFDFEFHENNLPPLHAISTLAHLISKFQIDYGLVLNVVQFTSFRYLKNLKTLLIMRAEPEASKNSAKNLIRENQNTLFELTICMSDFDPFTWFADCTFPKLEFLYVPLVLNNRIRELFHNGEFRKRFPKLRYLHFYLGEEYSIPEGERLLKEEWAQNLGNNINILFSY